MLNGEGSHAAGAGPSAVGAADLTPLHEQGIEPASLGAQNLQASAEPMVPATTLAPGVDPEEAERSLITDTRPSQQGPSGAKQKLAGRSIVADAPPSTDSRAVAAAYRYDWAAYQEVATVLARLRLSRGLGHAAGASWQGAAAAALEALGQGQAASGDGGGHSQARLTEPSTAWGHEEPIFLGVGGDGEHMGQAGGTLHVPAPSGSGRGAAEHLSAAGQTGAAHPVHDDKGAQQQETLPPEREVSEGSLGSLDIESPKPPPRKGRRRWGKDPVLRKSDEGAAEVQPLLCPTRSTSSVSEDLGEAADRWAAPLLVGMPQLSASSRLGRFSARLLTGRLLGLIQRHGMHVAVKPLVACAPVEQHCFPSEYMLRGGSSSVLHALLLPLLVEALHLLVTKLSRASRGSANSHLHSSRDWLGGTHATLHLTGANSFCSATEQLSSGTGAG